MDIKKIQDLINKRYPDIYSETGMQKVMEKIENLSEELRTGLEEFLVSNKIPEVEAEGYSVEKLKIKYGMNEIAAILTLDWLKREPEKAKESLSRGIK